MSPLQSIVVFLALVALGFSPWIFSKARRRDEKDLQGERVAPVAPDALSPTQALARHMYGEAYGWGKLDMLNYDHNLWVREPWERSAAKQIHYTNPKEQK